MPFCNDVGPVDRIRRKLKHSCNILTLRPSSELLRPDVKLVKCFTPARFSIFYIVPEKTAYIATFLAIYPSQCHNWPLTLEIFNSYFSKTSKSPISKINFFLDFFLKTTGGCQRYQRVRRLLPNQFQNFQLIPQKFPKIGMFNIKHNLARSFFILKIWELRMFYSHILNKISLFFTHTQAVVLGKYFTMTNSKSDRGHLFCANAEEMELRWPCDIVTQMIELLKELLVLVVWTKCMRTMRNIRDA